MRLNPIPLPPFHTTTVFLAAVLAGGALFAACGGGEADTSKPPGGEGGSTSTSSTSGTAGSGPGCPVGQILCGQKCVDPSYDPSNCGGCGKACQQGEFCSQGTCGMQCGGGTVQCGNLCVNTANDPAHCGGCDQACPKDQICGGGKCVLSCEAGGGTNCGGKCVDTNTDALHCGKCDNACEEGEVCKGGECGLQCVGGTTNCGGICVDLNADPKHCGSCETACQQSEVCAVGVCTFECIGGTTKCGNLCVDTKTNPSHCGACDTKCGVDEVCLDGKCSSVCGGGLTKCGNLCVDLKTSDQHCGKCGAACGQGASCKAGACVKCDSNTTDCDGDGWKVADGDCCDQPGACGLEPKLINPGAIEVAGNNIDDNCNGLTDLFDADDTVPCDSGLASSSTNAVDYAKTLGICRQTVENPPNPKNKTWGLISAALVRADGSALGDHKSHSIRSSFGKMKPAVIEGQGVAVFSSGIAADAAQQNPGPNGGAPGGGNVSNTHSPASEVNIQSCNDPSCIKDWFASESPGLKKKNELPVAPNCGSGSAGSPQLARDSVMLKLRLRAPTNAKAFSFNSFFISAEYPEYVCSNYNDQLIALVATPNGTPSPIPNPPDKNLMIYNDGQKKWPVGINIASGTNLFAVCVPQNIAGNCWDNDVSNKSCALGNSQLAGTGFDKPQFDSCDIGGGTFWLTTAGNVIPGDILELRVVIWDVGDTALDSLALVDGFKWLSSATVPGTE